MGLNRLNGAQPALLITCEHGGNAIPRAYRNLFKGRRALLASHRGYDPGALEVASCLAQRLAAPLYAARTSRLLVDPNRSIGHPGLFSSFTRHLAEHEKQRILADHYAAHRDPIEAHVRRLTDAGRTVVHIACHSFTPVLSGRVRAMDVGLLYDPARAQEARFCSVWKNALARALPGVRVRRNAPYKGVSDGLTSCFRKHWPELYLGLELEVNQRDCLQGSPRWRRVREALVDSLACTLATCGRSIAGCRAGPGSP